MYKYLQNCQDKFIDADPILKLQIVREQKFQPSAI